jgi:hypothetical protein
VQTTPCGSLRSCLLESRWLLCCGEVLALWRLCSGALHNVVRGALCLPACKQQPAVSPVTAVVTLVPTGSACCTACSAVLGGSACSALCVVIRRGATVSIQVVCMHNRHSAFSSPPARGPVFCCVVCLARCPLLSQAVMLARNRGGE